MTGLPPLLHGGRRGWERSWVRRSWDGDGAGCGVSWQPPPGSCTAQHEDAREQDGRGSTEGQADLGSRGTAGLGEPWGDRRNGNITGLGTSWESRGVADLGASWGYHRNGGIRDLGASWESGGYCEFRNIMGASRGCHGRAGTLQIWGNTGVGASWAWECHGKVGTLWVWEHHGSIAGMGITGLGTLQKQHGGSVGLGAPQERERGGMGSRDTSPVWLRGLPQPGQAGTAATDGL